MLKRDDSRPKSRVVLKLFDMPRIQGAFCCSKRRQIVKIGVWSRSNLAGGREIKPPALGTRYFGRSLRTWLFHRNARYTHSGRLGSREPHRCRKKRLRDKGPSRGLVTCSFSLVRYDFRQE